MALVPVTHNTFRTRSALSTRSGKAFYYDLNKLEASGVGEIARLPFSIKILLEALLRHEDGELIARSDIEKLAHYKADQVGEVEVPFKPARVLMQDFTGVPAIVDLASLRSAIKDLGGDPKCINPIIPVDLVIDHSVQVDSFNSPDALQLNSQKEFQRNSERYQFLRWGQSAFANLNIVPPASGIVHQVNLEYLASVVVNRSDDGKPTVFPDSLVGTDSHTTMINGLGVLGWGVGGIEAEAAMLGQPVYFLAPEVVGFKLNGQLPEGATATDLVLTITQVLREKGVVGKFVEFYGPALKNMTIPDRATVANMAPEYGATMGFFPVDQTTLRYLEATGRKPDSVDLVDRYCQTQGLYYREEDPEPHYSHNMEMDLSTVVPTLAGPKRPQDRIDLHEMQKQWKIALTAPVAERGFGLENEELKKKTEIEYPAGVHSTLTHGNVVIAAITSCTNTSNPSVLIAAGLLAKKASEAGLTTKPYVKTSLAPGSKVVTDYLDATGLSPYLNALGFHTVGYGCTTCIGNSGPLPSPVADAIGKEALVVASVLSGNRNFEGRISPHVKASYLASPPLVVAYALAGTVDIDFEAKPLGYAPKGESVFLRDVWPTTEEIDNHMKIATNPEIFNRSYQGIEEANEAWNEIPVAGSDVYAWKEESTYIQRPPFFQDFTLQPGKIEPIEEAYILGMFGNSITTDHISPAGAIAKESPAGTYLSLHGVQPEDFNSYGSRRGNDRLMTRGTFANVRIRNALSPEKEGGFTTHFPTGEISSIYKAAERYKEEGNPVILVAGSDYGMGSSRDWAAKGTALLGIKAVIAQSYERIHRSNLIGMGVLPLQFLEGQNAETLKLSGREMFTIHIDDRLKPAQEIQVTCYREEGRRAAFKVLCRIDSPIEIDYYRHGGILPMVLRGFLDKERN